MNHKGDEGMTTLEERILIYTALAVICAFAGAFVGLAAGALTFIQVAAIVEALYWFGLPGGRSFNPREHRTLFN
jgi:hypothetical protein